MKNHLIKGQLLSGHTDKVNSLTFHPNGQLLASGSNDGTLRIWYLDNNKNITLK